MFRFPSLSQRTEGPFPALKTSVPNHSFSVKLYFQLFSLFLKKDLLIPSGYPMGYSGDLATRVTYSKAKAVPTTRIQGFPGAEPESPYESFRSTDQASFAIPEPVSLSGRPMKCERGVTTRVEGKVR